MEKSYDLTGKKVAILATDGFEESELLEPRQALEDVGADINIVSLKSGDIRSWSKKDWGKAIKVDKSIDQVKASQYDALMIPGGVINADALRMNEAAVKFVSDFIDSGKPIAAICHAPWLLVETGKIRNRTITSWPSLKTDIENAGAHWVDREVITDNGLVTSRMPDDIPVFNSEMIEEFHEGAHRGHSHVRTSSSYYDRLN